MNKFEQGRKLMVIQGDDGNWDYDDYMHGMYNGMELMLSLIEGREPSYRDAPDNFKRHMKSLEEL